MEFYLTIKNDIMSSSVNLVKHHIKQNKQGSDKYCMFAPRPSKTKIMSGKVEGDHLRVKGTQFGKTLGTIKRMIIENDGKQVRSEYSI